MKRSVLVVITLVVSAAAFVLSRIIWPDLPNMPMPTAGQVPLFAIVGMVESLAFGVGIAFFVSLWSHMRGRGAGDWLLYLSATWLLISWWPHDNLHRTTEMADYGRLLAIEYGFHVTLVIAGVIVASHLWKYYAARQ